MFLGSGDPARRVYFLFMSFIRCATVHGLGEQCLVGDGDVTVYTDGQVVGKGEMVSGRGYNTVAERLETPPMEWLGDSALLAGHAALGLMLDQTSVAWDIMLSFIHVYSVC